MTAEMPPCAHVWRLLHQDDFPIEIFWVSTCRICGTIDGAALTRQIADLVAEVAKVHAEMDSVIDNARMTRQWADSVEAEQIAGATA